jgi:hypothetical protein
MFSENGQMEYSHQLEPGSGRREELTPRATFTVDALMTGRRIDPHGILERYIYR